LLDAPDAVEAIHRDYIRAGADVITANNYMLTPTLLARAGLEPRLEELIDVAERAHAVFPECAQLGVDLIREVPSGDIYVLEVNGRGGGWLLSSPSLNEACAADLAHQRDGLRRAGRLLADAAVRLAE